LEERCSGCRPDQPGEQPGEYILNAPHDAKNLRAQFRVAWDDVALYLFAQVEDDEIVALDLTNPEQQDGVELLLDGRADGTKGYGPDDHHLFIGALGKNVFAKNPSDLGSSDNVTVTGLKEQACYFVQVRLTWFYVMGLRPHTPAAGNTYGFTIAVNDWDTSPASDGGKRIQRQNQLFWVQPGFDYSFNTSQFAKLTLR
ncbi:MAG TPA: sugar-binding protein, partial [Polyangiaceae bacterium]